MEGKPLHPHWIVVGMLTVAKLLDVTGQPMVKVDLPSPLRKGDPLRLRCRLEREADGRLQHLVVDHLFLVESVGFEGKRQLTALSATGKAPTWVSVKRPPKRFLGPAKHPPEEI